MEDLSKYKDLFLSDGRERLANLNTLLVDFEKSNNKELLNDMMREAHTLKGMAATMEYPKMAYFCHILEDVFDYARFEVLDISKVEGLFGKIFNSLDEIKNSLDLIEKTNKEKDLDYIAKELKNLTGVKTQGMGPSPRIGGKPIALVKKKPLKPKKETEPSKPVTLEIEEIKEIKVKTEVLDQLLNLSGEFIINKMKLVRAFEILDYPTIKEELKTLDKNTSDLHNLAVRTRLIPVGFVFDYFPRTVRDLSEKEHKEVDLELLGQDIELDRTIIEKLPEILLHLVRNAIDHGIQEKGTLILKASREKEQVIIEVIDDGCGIDIEEIKKAALKRKIITQEELDKMSEKDIFNLLFNPQLSTSKKITTVSGRGVGLNVVKRDVEHLRGIIKIESEKGKGTKVLLNFPLTLAIIKAFIFQVGEMIFAIPTNEVRETIEISKDSVKTIEGAETFILRDETLSLVRLKDVFNLEPLPKESFLVMVWQKGDEKIGLEIDKILKEQEIVVKPFIPPFKFKNFFNAVTILEDGNIVPVLNVRSILEG